MPTDRARAPRPSMAPWILALSAVPILAAAGWGVLAFARHPDEGKDRATREALARLFPAVEASLRDRAEDLTRLGVVIARDPKFFAVLTLSQSDRSGPEFRNAVLAVLRDFQRDAGVPLFAISDERGRIIASVDVRSDVDSDLSNAPFIRRALAGKPGFGYVAGREALYRVAAVPVSAGGVLVGVLCLGEGLDATGARFKSATGCDLVFLSGQTIASTTLPPSPLRKSLAQWLGAREKSSSDAIRALTVDGQDLLALQRALPDPWQGTGAPGLILVRPVEPHSSPIALIRSELIRAALLGIGLSLVCGGMTLLAMRLGRGRLERSHEAEIAEIRAGFGETAGLVAGAATEIVDATSTVETVTDLVADSGLGNLSEPQREGVAAIRVAATTLARVGRDLEHLALAERGALTLQVAATDVGAIVERAAILMFPLASSRGQTVSLSAEPNLIHPAADGARLARAVQSLVYDAICTFPEGGRVDLVARRSETGIAVEVYDSGIAERPAERSDPDGVPAALGRTVASLIAERHGGTLRARSASGPGYVMELPFPPSVLTAQAQVSPDEPFALAS